MAALLVPFGNCVELLNPTVVHPILSDGMKTAFSYVRGLEEADFKDKVITFALLRGICFICRHVTNFLIWHISCKTHLITYVFLSPNQLIRVIQLKWNHCVRHRELWKCREISVLIKTVTQNLLHQQQPMSVI